MTPLALLRIWRQRWGILEGVPDGATAHVPLDQEDWGIALAGMGVWSNRLMTACATLLGVLLLAAAGLMVFGIAGQLTLGLLVMALAIYIRCYRGLLAFLVLGGLALLCGTRYLSWRWQYTLPDGALYPFGLCLLLVEILAFVAFALWMTRMAWPLYQEPVSMPRAEHNWPYVDVVLVAPASGLDNIGEFAAALAAQKWPLGRMHVFVQDASADPRLRAACRSLGFTHVAGQADATQVARPRCLDARLPQGNGEYVLVFEADACAELRNDPMLLQRWAAWLRNDQALAMLYTPGHPMAPDLRVSIDELQLQSSGTHLALLRRAAWKHQPPGGLDHLVERLEATNYYTALVGHPQRDASASSPATDVVWVRIDDVGDGRSVLKRQRLNRASQFLRAMLPWTLAAMVLGTLAIPLTGVMLIQTPLPWFAAYVVPYAVMMFLAWSDALNLHRLDVGSEIREWMLALVLPLIVAARVLSVVLRRAFSRTEVGGKATWSFKLYSRLAVCVIALVLALLRLAMTGDAILLPWLGAVALVTIYAIALTLSRWAAGQEARSLRDTFAVQPCTLITASGKSIECRTRNFPAQRLQLDFDHDVSGYDTDLNETSGHKTAGSRFTLLIGSERPARVSGPATFLGSRGALMDIAAISQPVYLRATHQARLQLLQKKYWLPGPDLGFTTLRSSEFQ